MAGKTKRIVLFPERRIKLGRILPVQQMEQVTSVNLVTCAALVYCDLPVKAIAGCERLAHVPDLPLGGLDLLVMTL